SDDTGLEGGRESTSPGRNRNAEGYKRLYPALGKIAAWASMPLRQGAAPEIGQSLAEGPGSGSFRQDSPPPGRQGRRGVGHSFFFLTQGWVRRGGAKAATQRPRAAPELHLGRRARDRGRRSRPVVDAEALATKLPI